MKKFLLSISIAVVIIGCNAKEDKRTATEKKTNTAKYTLDKEGIEELKIGITQAQVEKILGQPLALRHVKDASEIWSDTAIVKYKDLDLQLFFERLTDSLDKSYLQLFGLETSSSNCKTANGIGVGDDKLDIINAYDNNINSIHMGPEFDRINDTIWLPSKTKYFINVSDTGYSNQLNFSLTNKKITSIGASVIMGD
jgi:hypothetical protein